MALPRPAATALTPTVPPAADQIVTPQNEKRTV